MGPGAQLEERTETGGESQPVGADAGGRGAVARSGSLRELSSPCVICSWEGGSEGFGGKSEQWRGGGGLRRSECEVGVQGTGNACSTVGPGRGGTLTVKGTGVRHSQPAWRS